MEECEHFEPHEKPWSKEWEGDCPNCALMQAGCPFLGKQKRAGRPKRTQTDKAEPGGK